MTDAINRCQQNVICKNYNLKIQIIYQLVLIMLSIALTYNMAANVKLYDVQYSQMLKLDIVVFIFLQSLTTAWFNI